MATLTQVIDTLQNLTNARVNQSDIARVLNITRGTVSIRVRKESQVTLEEIQKLEKAYNVELKPKKLSPETKENVLKQLEELRESIEKIQNKQKSNKQQIEKSEDCILLPVRGNLSASMGYGIEVIDESETAQYPTPRNLIRALGLNPKTTEYVPAEGDSMEPTIYGGSLLLVDHSRTEVKDGKIYCVRMNNALMAKRLQFVPPKKIAVISDNQKYKTFEVDFSKELDFDFEVIGEVRWWGTLAR